MTTGVVENYPGFAEPTTGPEIMLAMREQAERFGCELVAKDVNHVDLSTWPFRVSYFGAEIEAEAIIVATGATAKRLELPSEEAAVLALLRQRLAREAEQAGSRRKSA